VESVFTVLSAIDEIGTARAVLAIDDLVDPSSDIENLEPNPQERDPRMGSRDAA
jgi:hypothetical protein